MKSYTTSRRRPFGEVVACTNEDRHPLEVIPYGKFGAGVRTGHPIESVVVLGILLVGLIAFAAPLSRTRQATYLRLDES